MSKANSIKNLISSHGWLGIVFSLPLLIVFWAGGLSLFLIEIGRWAEMPHHPFDPNKAPLPVLEQIDKVLPQTNADTSGRLTYVPPSKYRAYSTLYYRDTEGKFHGLKLKPDTGEVLGDSEQFDYAHFLYALHYNLNLGTIGTYAIGIATLFMFFAILSGIVIHLKKIVPQLFHYRPQKKRVMLLDLHTLVGVISLPYTIMYTITGLIFNLVIVYQASMVVFLYQGNTQQLMNDVGFFSPAEEPKSQVKADMSRVYELVEQSEIELGEVRQLRFFNYGHDDAILYIRGDLPGDISTRYEAHYRISSGEQLNVNSVDNNNFIKGQMFLNQLHFGDYAGTDLRILYFVLALLICALIIAGNILWVEKRRREATQYSRTKAIVSNLTLGSCVGLLCATALGFLLERLIPGEWANRNSLVIFSFVAMLSVFTALAFVIKNKRALLRSSLYLCALLIALCLAADAFLFGTEIRQLISYGFKDILGFQIGMLLSAIAAILVATTLAKDKPNAKQEKQAQKNRVNPAF
ncbi:PepSY-associated TM helix domain-containing protein [uncultured Pseudoteredinibacter sp.]|uniref:PepSY-associated TM helix domain-containing protein n=1 Tax=uncultured Pseudoteredinibacter sp. TaxID=1641701 RepID=UPI0026084592|nr:PepSY-associated TM helix domain-containing protein [uncultured Pseudoteredinibacter sp.]